MQHFRYKITHNSLTIDTLPHAPLSKDTSPQCPNLQVGRVLGHFKVWLICLTLLGGFSHSHCALDQGGNSNRDHPSSIKRVEGLQKTQQQISASHNYF